MYIRRVLEDQFRNDMDARKAVLLYGPRQCGKTTLLKHWVGELPGETLWLSGDDPSVRSLLSGITLQRWRNVLGNRAQVVIDEAQKIPDIGNAIKLVTDNLPDCQVFASGSSSFEFASRTEESLTGRKFEYRLLPFSFRELADHADWMQERGCLEQRLVYGSYPEIVANPSRADRLLDSLAGSYLYKDVLTTDRIQRPDVVDKLVKALALQLGSEVSISELARLIGANTHTVERYIDILEKAFVVFRLPSFCRNQRNEIAKGRKIYFYDNGIRNAVIGNYLPVDRRTDVGALWENYLVSERVKKQVFAGDRVSRHFWRTFTQSEVDYVEETTDGTLRAYEFKWNPRTRDRIPSTFLAAYPQAEPHVITPENYADDFL